jgi:FkbM family methyltransferase
VEEVTQVVRGVHLPDRDTHMAAYIERGPSFAGKGTYQLTKLMSAMTHIHDFRHAVDVGAHVGTWSRPLARMFSRVTAFEPMEQHRECFVKNVPANDPRCKIKLYDCGLGAAYGMMAMSYSESISGGAHLTDLANLKGGEDPVRIAPLDSFDLTEVDFIKIDVEGFEVDVIRGGEQTIKKWKPTIVVEQKPGNGKRFGHTDTEAVELLRSWGAEKKWEIGGDNCLRWKHR